MYYFYILQSQQNTEWFYKGITADLKKRLVRHKTGQVRSTASYVPLRLVYYEVYLSKAEAKRREWSVKYHGSVSVPLLKRIKRSLADLGGDLN